MCHASEQELNGQKKIDTDGCYANYFQIGFNACEFICDFGQFYPETETIRFHTRIITTPTYMKNLIEVLQESFREYQRQYESPTTLPIQTASHPGERAC